MEYKDASGRVYKGKERVCPQCNKKEIVRESNNSKLCQLCARPPADKTVVYKDSSGNEYSGRIRVCRECGDEAVVRKTNKSLYCKKCVYKYRTNSITDDELYVLRKTGVKQRAKKILCPACGKERIVRTDHANITKLCRSCSSKENTNRNFRTGIKHYRQRALDVLGEICKFCGSTKDLHVHHINGDRSDNTVFNLAPLCQSCHVSIHWQIRKGLSHEEAFDLVKEKKTTHPHLSQQPQR